MGQRHNERETERGIKAERQNGMEGGKNHINTDCDKCCFLALLHLAYLGRQCMLQEGHVCVCVSDLNG